MKKGLYLIPLLFILTGCSTTTTPQPILHEKPKVPLDKQETKSFNKIPYTTGDISFEKDTLLLFYNYSSRYGNLYKSFSTSVLYLDNFYV